MNSMPDPVYDSELVAAVGEVDAPAPVADEVLLASVDRAREALLEITPAATIGEPAGHIVEDEHVVSLLFHTTLEGYPGWFWTVSLTRVEGSEPTVLEAELMPGESALLAPDWIPWSERLADYRASQEAAEAAAREAAEAELADDDDLDEEEDEDDEFDEDLDDDEDDDDLDEDVVPVLHSGDLDGVDVDALDDDADDDFDDESDEGDSDDDADADDDYGDDR